VCGENILVFSMLNLENGMQLALTMSSICYVVLSAIKTLYGVGITKEKEERFLTHEAVYHVWNTFVKAKKVSGQWGDLEKLEARARVVAYVRHFESCHCSCYRTRVARIYDWIKEDVETWKKSRSVRSTPDGLYSSSKSYRSLDILM